MSFACLLYYVKLSFEFIFALDFYNFVRNFYFQVSLASKVETGHRDIVVIFKKNFLVIFKYL